MVRKGKFIPRYRGSERGRETDFIDRLICAGVVKNCSYGGSCSLDAAA